MPKKSADSLAREHEQKERQDDVLRFVERFGSSLTEAGMQRLPSRAFAALLADEDGRMTAAELADYLNISPASVSGAVRYLEQVRMVHRERERGSRKDVFVVADDAWHDMMMNTTRIYQPLEAALAEGVNAVGGPGTRAGARLATSVEFLAFVGVEVAAIARKWDEHRAALAKQEGEKSA